MSKTAKLVKWVNNSINLLQAVYKLSEPVTFPEYRYDGEEGSTSEHVLVSGVNSVYAHETYIFPCDEAGYVLDLGELAGSFQGGIDHGAALAGLGYEVVS